MGLLSRVAQLREEQILSHADPFVEDGEEIVLWVRASNFDGKRARGFLYATPTRVILFWTRGPGTNCCASWDEIEAWGVNRETKGGPVLAIEAHETDIHAQIPVTTSGMAQQVRTFLKVFADSAPIPARTLRPQAPPGTFESNGEVEVEAKRRSITEHTKRVLITILGIIMVIGGMLITPLPGPWSFPVIVAGLAVLATEYDWADDALDAVKRKSQQLVQKVRGGRESDESTPSS